MKVKDLLFILGQLDEDEKIAYAVFEEDRHVNFDDPHDITGVAFNHDRWYLTVDANSKNHF